MLARVNAAGRYQSGPLVNIDTAHRQGILHKGVWLHILSADDALLLTRRAMTMKTCPGLLSIIGEHHNGRESNDDCAGRALSEEMPGLVKAYGPLNVQQLRSRPRWFLFDYPVEADNVPRYDRCLISEYVARLPVNATDALDAIERGHEHEREQEASSIEFVPLDALYKRLHHEPKSFCARELLPLALRDTVADIADIFGYPLRVKKRAGALAGFAALPEEYDPSLVTRSAKAGARLKGFREGWEPQRISRAEAEAVGWL